MEQFEINKIRDKLIADKISYQDAYDQIKKYPKPWQRSDWIKNRSEILKEHCEKCGTKEAIFVIQHTKHPEKFSDKKDRVNQKIRNLFFTELNEIDNLIHTPKYKFLNYITALASFSMFEERVKMIISCIKIDQEGHLDDIVTIRDCCPVCIRLVTERHYKKTFGFYKCEDKHEFDTPNKIKYYTPYRTKDREQARYKSIMKLLRSEKYEIDQQVYKLKKKVDDHAGKIALIKNMKESEVYMSLKYTKTYCKPCAFKEDKERGLIR